MSNAITRAWGRLFKRAEAPQQVAVRQLRNTPQSLAAFYDSARGDFAAVRTGRLNRRRLGVPLTGADADYHYRSESDYLKLIEYARDMDRNEAFIGQAIDRATNQTIQDGFRLSPRSSDEGLNKAIKDRWNAWANDADACDMAGEMTFPDFEWYGLRHMLVDGDSVVLGTNSGALQFVEAHRVRTPRDAPRNVVHGVELTSTRRRTRYWVTRTDVDPMRTITSSTDMRQYLVRNGDGLRQIFHVYSAKRISQTRGISALAPCSELVTMFGDINVAKLVQQQLVSAIGLIEKRPLEFDQTNAAKFGAQSTEQRGDTVITKEDLRPGMRIVPPPGTEITGFSPNIPNPEFFDQAKMILTMIGCNIGLPLVMMLMDASETNFSGFRGAIEMARMGFRENQGWLVERLHRPVYQWKLAEWAIDDKAIAAALKSNPLDAMRHEWHPPGWPYIEPNKDTSARAMQMETTQKSPRRIQAEDGRDWTTTVDETVEDHTYAITRAAQAADKINQQFGGARVTWRDLLGKSVVKAVMVKDAAEPQDDADGGSVGN